MLSDRIQYLRQKAGLTQSQLAKQLNISASTEGMYEQGRRTPNLDTLIAIAKVFGVSLDYLITGSDFKNPDAVPEEVRIARECPCSTCYWKNHVDGE